MFVLNCSVSADKDCHNHTVLSEKILILAVVVNCRWSMGILKFIAQTEKDSMCLEEALLSRQYLLKLLAIRGH